MRTLFDDGWTALHLATKSTSELFRYIAEDLGGDLKLSNKNGVTLAQKASMDDKQDILEYLQSRDALLLN